MKYVFNDKEMDEATLKKVATLAINECVARIAKIEGTTVNATIGFCFRSLTVPNAKFEECRDATEQQTFLQSDQHLVRVAPRIIIRENLTRFAVAIYEGSLQIPDPRLKAAILHNPAVLQEVPERFNITINPVNFKRAVIDESAINMIGARRKNISSKLALEIKNTLLGMIQENIEAIKCPNPVRL